MLQDKRKRMQDQLEARDNQIDSETWKDAINKWDEEFFSKAVNVDFDDDCASLHRSRRPQHCVARIGLHHHARLRRATRTRDVRMQ